MSFFKRFLEFIHVNGLYRSDERVLLALSGGVDSMVLAHLLQQATQPFGIAHCNFQLRGKESDGDEAFVRLLGETWDVPVHVERFDTEQYASDHGCSIQMAARDLRYAWFETIRAAHGFDRIATAHNLNDSVETVLLNFTRGTGLNGLGGIAIQNGAIVRPLLFATRPEIAEYAKSNQIQWREDRSNSTDDYARNLIRHQIVPKLEALNPAFLNTGERSLHRLRDTASNLQFLSELYFGKNIQSIDKERIMAFPAPKQMLYELLKPFGFSDEQARQMIETLSKTGQEWQSPDGFRVLNDRDVFMITGERQKPSGLVQVYEDDLMVSLPENKRLVFMPAIPEGPFPDGHDGVLLDAEKLQYPLRVRSWLPGDQFQPFGMGGKHQKLQDFFTNLKLSQLDKERVLILENGDGAIIWIIGYRFDERFKIEPNTHKALKINRVDLN